MKPICLLFCICFLYFGVYSQTPKDSINTPYMVGISLLPVIQMTIRNTGISKLYREIIIIGGSFAYKISKEKRVVTTLNLYNKIESYSNPSSNKKILLYPNMADYNLKGLQLKIGMQHLSNPYHYKYVNYLIGYAVGISKNESKYQIILTDNYQNVYLYPVAENFWMGTFELQGGFNFNIFKRLELASYLQIGRKWQSQKLRYELISTFPLLGYITPDYFINFNIDLWYRL